MCTIRQDFHTGPQRESISFQRKGWSGCVLNSMIVWAGNWAKIYIFCLKGQLLLWRPFQNVVFLNWNNKTYCCDKHLKGTSLSCWHGRESTQDWIGQPFLNRQSWLDHTSDFLCWECCSSFPFSHPSLQCPSQQVVLAYVSFREGFKPVLHYTQPVTNDKQRN